MTSKTIRPANQANIDVLQHIKAVSFDLDDTLWDCAPAIVHAEAELYRWMAANTPAVIERYSPAAVHEHRMQMFRERPDLATDVSLMRKASLSELMQSCNYNDSNAAQAYDVFYRARSEVVLYSGTHDLLEALGGRYQLAAISNGNADLSLIGLARYFGDIQLASLNNAPKPATEMFERTLQAFKLPANAMLHIGDNPHSDVLGGHNAGVYTVWFNQHQANWPEDVPFATFEVSSLAELQELLC